MQSMLKGNIHFSSQIPKTVDSAQACDTEQKLTNATEATPIARLKRARANPLGSAMRRCRLERRKQRACTGGLSGPGTRVPGSSVLAALGCVLEHWRPGRAVNTTRQCNGDNTSVRYYSHLGPHPCAQLCVLRASRTIASCTPVLAALPRKERTGGNSERPYMTSGP